MNQDITIKILDWLQNLGNLAAEELPVFVREAAMYGACSNLIRVVIFAFIFVWAFRVVKDFDIGETDEKGAVLFAVSIGAVIISSIAILVSSDAAAKAICAPRLYVIEKVKRL